MRGGAVCLLWVALALTWGCDSGAGETVDGTDVADVADVADVTDVADGPPTPDARADLGPDTTIDAVTLDVTPDVAPDVVPTFPDPPKALGGDRPVTMELPASYDPTVAAPLLILLHGYSASGLLQDLYWGISSYTTENGILFLKPDGTVDAGGNHFWNATDYCCNFGGSDIDDVAYIRGLIDEAKTYYNVDPDRIYLMGHSNGGFMSYRMACEASDVVAGIVSLAGVTWMNPADCGAPSPVAVLQVHGTADDTIFYDGDFNAPSARQSVDYWAGIAGCDEEPTDGGPMDLLAADGDDAEALRWSGCTDGAAVELWTIPDGSHIPALNDQWPALPIQWLLTHALR